MTALSRSLSLGLALVLATCAAALPLSAAARAATADRPFKGHASGAIVSFPDPMLGTPGVAKYTGQATHLGRFTRTEYFFLGAHNEVFGSMVYTAANGDHLYLDFDGLFISPTTAQGTYEFTGGTGRFRNATGTATFEAVLGAGGHVEATFDGSIQY